MLTKMNFKSKKGMSLAVALTICLFMILITGGITTVAMLQQTETGSNMNSRQAYISAKSGLDTMQDALQEQVISGSSLPSTGNSKYYVMYYDELTGDLKTQRFDSEDDARDAVSDLAADGHTIVGGEGTYFKITNTDGKKHNVTALNVTGKYNNNVSLNRGDLSFDMINITTYTFKLDPTPAPTDPPTPPVTDPPTGETPSSLNGRFMLVGQQTCLNEGTKPGQGNQSTGRTLNQYTIEAAGGSNAVLSNMYYMPYNEMGVVSDYAYTYFPVVYDKMVKVTSDPNRVSIDAINEGFYLVGGTSGTVPQSFVNDGTNLGTVSYMTQNDCYRQVFGCKFFCLKNNFVTIRPTQYRNSTVNDPIIKYAGSDYPSNGQAYVVAYLPQKVTFFVLDRDYKKVTSFTKDPGYYLINTGANNAGAPVTDESTWNNKITDTATIAQWEAFNLYNTIESYLNSGGEIHTGTQEYNYERVGSTNVEIVNNDGKYNRYESSKTGYSTSSTWSPDFSSRTNHNVFFSPNYPVEYSGYYNWYCGKTFNFQWFRNSATPLSVANGAHVRMSASTIVLTIGPQVTDANGNIVQVSNVMSGAGDGSWQLYGPNNSGSPVLHVMSPIVVKYNGRQYTIQDGTYANVPAGINLFSEEGEKYFLYSADIRALNDPSVVIKYPTTPPASLTSTTSTGNSRVMPASISTQTVRTLSLFSRVKNGLALSPMSLTIDDTTDHTYTIDGEGPFLVNNEILVNSKITNLYYNDQSNDGKHSIPLTSVEFKIKMKLSDTEYKDIIIFTDGSAGRYIEIPANAGETVFDVYDGAELAARASHPDANYTLVSEESFPVILEEYY